MILRNFIVFEGIDGAGTSTQIDLVKQPSAEQELAKSSSTEQGLIKQESAEQGLAPVSGNVALTAEPTKGEVGRFLRRVLSGEVTLSNEAMAYLFAADRAEHLYGDGGIVQTAQSKIVISDRYLFSSIVYQGEVARLINSTFPLPQLLFYFKITGEEAFRRVMMRSNQTGQATEIFEKRDTLCALAAKYDSLIAEYQDMMRNFPAQSEKMQIVVLDASKSKEEIASVIRSYIRGLRS